MTDFNWRIDWENYLNNNHKKADKLTLKEFVKKICAALDDYKKYSMEDLLSAKVPHCHSCNDLDKRENKEAKVLVRHLIKVNDKLAKDTRQIELHNVLQLSLKGIDNLPYRCFGYVEGNLHHIVYFDPKHEIYKE